MQFAVFTASLPEYNPEEAVALLAEVGYDGVEWRVTDQAPSPDGRPGFWAGNRCTLPLSSFVEDAPRVRDLTERAGLAMPNVGAYFLCDDLDGVEQGMRGSALLGAPCMRVRLPHYEGSESYVKLRDRALENFRAVESLAWRHGVRALVETHQGTLAPSASAAARFLERFDPRYVGAIHDAGNMVVEGYEQYRLGLETLGPYLAHVHLKNCRWRVVGTRPDGSEEWRAEWAPLTQGVVDVAALFRALRNVGYDGWISFEDFSTEQPLRRRIRDNLAYVKQVAARQEALA
jgi:sugar phosphate isomerase/epimerase